MDINYKINLKKCAELLESDERLTIIEEIIRSEIEQKTNTENKSRAVIIFVNILHVKIYIRYYGWNICQYEL